MTLSHWLGSRIADPVLSKMEPVMKMANKWISKVLGRELQEVCVCVYVVCVCVCVCVCLCVCVCVYMYGA